MGTHSRMEKVSKCGSVNECLGELMKELGPLYRHKFNAEWQRNQLYHLKRNLPEDWVIIVMDFAENFLCKFQDEPQSAHWAYRQVTVFPAVVHSRCSCGELRRDNLVFLSDDLRHDACITQVFIENILEYVSKLRNMKKVLLVSDGCAAQFKSKLPFLFLARSTLPHSKGASIEKVFFGARHGKNDCDWCDGAVKRNVTRDIASGAVTVNGAQDMFEHCSRTMSHSEGPGECLHKVQRFFLIEPDQVDRKINSSMVKTIHGSRKLHHVRVQAQDELAIRTLSCFCKPCMSEDYAHCLSAAHVPGWQTAKLKFAGSVPFHPQDHEDEKVDCDTLQSEEDSAHIAESEYSDTDFAPSESPVVAFEQEVMSILRNASYTGLWEFLAASHVLRRPILSVF
ncbi:uncharacterized protein LOC143275737 [Babylonia areolata]|uniref:uncharacterized protein LOC143275737 n=1 Tax=Babylonia areolata TaxID=304850 RepID=UPI003FD34539